jgi:hypothetical protein
MPRLSYSMSVLVVCRLAFADIVPIPGTQLVPPVFEQSDIVCNCVTESIETLGENTSWKGGKPLVRRHEVARIHALDLYKSNRTSDATLTVEFDEDTPVTGASMPVVLRAQVALLFLRESRPGVYVFSDPFLGVTPFSQIPLGKGPTGISKLESALSSALESRIATDQINALRLLEGMQEFDQLTIERLNLLSASPDSNVALSALAVLLKADPTSGVVRLDRYLRSNNGDPQSVAILSIGSELGEVTDQRAAPALGSLTSSTILSIRFGAVNALRKLADPGGAPSLIKELDDPDRNIRFSALKALSEIFKMKGDYSPITRDFESKPDYYTNLWKQWWAQNRDAVPEPNR